MRSEAEANRAIDLYADTVRRICMVHLKSYADTEDIFQSVFLKYVLSSAVFENEEHEKAWFMRQIRDRINELSGSSNTTQYGSGSGLSGSGYGGGGSGNGGNGGGQHRGGN